MYRYRCSTPFTIHYNFTFTSRSLQWLRSNTKWTSYSTESPLYPDPTLYQKNPPITSRIRTEPMARGMTGYPARDLRYRSILLLLNELHLHVITTKPQILLINIQEKNFFKCSKSPHPFMRCMLLHVPLTRDYESMLCLANFTLQYNIVHVIENMIIPQGKKIPLKYMFYIIPP